MRAMRLCAVIIAAPLMSAACSDSGPAPRAGDITTSTMAATTTTKESQEPLPGDNGAALSQEFLATVVSVDAPARRIVWRVLCAGRVGQRVETSVASLALFDVDSTPEIPEAGRVSTVHFDTWAQEVFPRRPSAEWRVQVYSDGAIWVFDDTIAGAGTADPCDGTLRGD